MKILLLTIFLFPLFTFGQEQPVDESFNKSSLTDIPFRFNINIQIDGLFDGEDWSNSKTIEITPNNSLLLIQDEDYLFIGIKNNEKVGRYIDLYMENDSIGTINLHASMQLGERHLSDNWNDSIPTWNWGNNVNWIANKVEVVDESEDMSFLESVKPYQGHEFQISKKKIRNKKVRIRIEIKDFVGRESDIVFPLNSEREKAEDWLLLEIN